MLRYTSAILLAAALGCACATPAPAYVDLSPTLGRIVNDAPTIAVAEVERFNPDKAVVVLKKVRDLRGTTSAGSVRHLVRRANETAIDRPILEWAEPGRQCVVFIKGQAAVVCVGEGWYQAHTTEDGWWRIGPARPDLPLAYYGTVSRLAEAIPVMLAGKSAVITAVPHGQDREGASVDLALNRAALPGLVKVFRVRANLRMPTVAFAVGGNPAFEEGTGRVAPEEVPALREKLRAADATVRAESAADLGFLGGAAEPAAGALAVLLKDDVPRVRLAAAAALLRIKANDEPSLDALAAGLASADPVTRRDAARSAGLAQAAAAPLAGRLSALLNDPDLLVRRRALQAIATVGPAAGSTAVAPLMKMLEQPETAVDAADALGRLGKSARPALKTIAPLLNSDAPAARWAAVRAMAQIGGDDAKPAVEFIVATLPGASEIDGYHMLIYLALLGPVARDAIPAIRQSRVKNPVLRQLAAWAISPGEDLPPGWGAFGPGDIVSQLILDGLVREGCDHFKAPALGLARKIMAGKAGNVPTWGYTLLARFADETLPILTPGLAAKDRIERERAAVALGFMGRAARPARDQIARALASAGDEREQRLLQWCLRELR
jgi:HEAT repeat protein